MKLISVTINNAPQKLQQFENSKLFGTLLSYHGYGLQINEIVNTCVPDYLLNKLNNNNEQNKKHE